MTPTHTGQERSASLIDGLEGFIRRGWVQAALWLVCSAVLALSLRGWSITRDVEFRVKFENVGPAWTIDWGPARGAARNGHWIDLSRTKGASGDVSVIAHPDLSVLRVRVATYRVNDVALRWMDAPPGARVDVADAFIDESVFGVRTRTARLVPLRVEGDSSETIDMRRLPIVARARGGDGGVYFACPALPWWYQFAVLAASAALCGIAWLSILGLFRLAGNLDRASTRWSDSPRPWRWLGLLAIVITVAIPAWLTSWAPMMVSGDSTAYILHTYLLHQNWNFDHFDGWRLPGYAVLILPFYAWMKNYAEGLAWAQAVMSLAPPLLAWAMLRGRVAKPWPIVAAIAVALDPAIFLWQRTLLTETQTTFLVMLSAWLFVECADRVQRGRGRPSWWALGLGLALAGACYTRPNIQVFAVLAPLALAAIAVLAHKRRWLLPSVVCAAAVGACMAPIIIFNSRTFSKAAVTVGSDWNREVWSWENGIMDWNQSGFFSFEQYRDIRTRCEAQKFSWWDLPQYAQKWGTPPANDGLHEWTQMDQRCRLLWEEAAARRGDAYLGIMPKAIGSMFGVRTRSPAYFHGDPYFLLGPIMGDDSHTSRYGDTNYLIDPGVFPPGAQQIFERARMPIGDVAHSWMAQLMKAWYKAWAFVRPALGALLLFSIVRLLRNRSLGLAALGIILLAHMVAVPLLVFTGADRYAMPWYGVMTVVIVAGLAWRSVGDHGRAGPQGGT